uniref:PGG domain-containing protein n=1 Tax=Oryza barthii TaxID=65489 RepID=A0A0D3H5D1_9ORYZ
MWLYRKPSPPPPITFRFSRHQGPLRRILDAHPISARIADNNGSFPIHVAASTGSIKALQILIAVDLTYAGLRDDEGRTFLHVAIQNKRDNTVEFACQEPKLAWVLNMQDNDGSTALHLAVLIGELRIFSYLMQNKQVLVSLQNYNEQTALDISFGSRTTGLSYGMDPRHTPDLGARHGNYRQDQFEEERIPKLDEEKESKKITESTQALGIGAVLVATATFAAAFTMPGGYRADDHADARRELRIRRVQFVVSNALAFTLSCIATTLLVLSGAAAVDTRARQASLGFAVAFLMGAARSFCVAFALGMYVVLAPVALATAIAACFITSFTPLDVTLFVRVFFIEARTLHRRLGIEAWWTLGKMIVGNLLSEFWCYIVIFGLPAVLKLKRN